MGSAAILPASPGADQAAGKQAAGQRRSGALHLLHGITLHRIDPIEGVEQLLPVYPFHQLGQPPFRRGLPTQDLEGLGRRGQQHSAVDAGGLSVEIGGVRRRFAVAAHGDVLVLHGPLGTATLTPVPRFPLAEREDLVGGCLAPMTGIVREVRVKEGDAVEKGTVLLVLEAMKMEHQMIARDVGVVTQVRVEVGQMVDPDEVLVVVEPREP